MTRIGREGSLVLGMAMTAMLCAVDVRAEELPAKPSIKASALYLVELKSGRVLLEKDATRRLPPASLTKIMTALVALESAPLQEVVKIDRRAIAPSVVSQIPGRRRVSPARSADSHAGLQRE